MYLVNNGCQCHSFSSKIMMKPLWSWSSKTSPSHISSLFHRFYFLPRDQLTGWKKSTFPVDNWDTRILLKDSWIRQDKPSRSEVAKKIQYTSFKFLIIVIAKQIEYSPHTSTWKKRWNFWTVYFSWGRYVQNDINSGTNLYTKIVSKSNKMKTMKFSHAQNSVSTWKVKSFQ